MALSGFIGGATRSLESVLADRRAKALQAEQQQRLDAQLQLQREQLERLRANDEADRERQTTLDNQAFVTDALSQLAPGDTVPESVTTRAQGTPSEVRLEPRMASFRLQAMDGAPQAGMELRGLTRVDTPGRTVLKPTAAQQEAMDTDREMGRAIRNAPEHLRPMLELQRGGFSGLQPDDFETPEQRAARLQAEEDAAVRRAGRIAGAQTAARAANATDETPPPTEGPSELAVMAAQNPSILQGLTPTDRAALLREIADHPELATRYQDTFMAPIRSQAETVMSALGDLVVPNADGSLALTPGARQIFGERTPVMARGLIPTAGATDANASLGQVIGQEAVSMLNELKSQSSTGATGFGALSERELDLLLSAATRLANRLSEGSALGELETLYRGFQKILQSSPQEVTAGTGSGDLRVLSVEEVP